MTNDIQIKVGLSTLKLKAELAELKNIFKNFQNDYTGKQILDVQKKIKEAQGGITEAINRTKFTDINKELRELSSISPQLVSGQKLFKNAIAKSSQDLDKLSKVGKGLAKQAKFQKDFFTDLDDLLDDVDKGIKKSRPEFQSWALSLMFAGMALKNMASSVMTWGTKAFDDVSHSIIGTITANDRLQGSMLYLGYVVGEAFQPILESLIPIVNSVSNWVSDNDELVAGMEALALIIGGTAGVVGALVLAKSGVQSFADKIKEFSWKDLGNTIKDGIGAISIGIGFYNVASAVNKMISGSEDSINSAFQAAGGVIQMMAGGMLIKGKSGAWIWLAVGFALQEESRNKLFTDIQNIIGVVLGLFTMLGATLKDKVFNPLFEMIGRKIQHVLEFYKIPVPDWVTNMASEGIGSTMSAKEAFQAGMKMAGTWGTQFDAFLAEAKKTPEAPKAGVPLAAAPELQKSNMYYNIYGMTVNTNDASSFSTDTNRVLKSYTG